MTTTGTEREDVMTGTPHEPETVRTDTQQEPETVMSDTQRELEPGTSGGPPSGDPRVLFAAAVLAALALLVTAAVSIWMAFQLGVVGAPLQQGQLFLLQGLLCAVIGVALIGNRDRVWLLAVVLATSGLIGILVSVYAPIPSVGPLPAIDEPDWLVTKAVVALAELTVIVLWLIRRIAPGLMEPTEIDDEGADEDGDQKPVDPTA